MEAKKWFDKIFAGGGKWTKIIVALGLLGMLLILLSVFWPGGSTDDSASKEGTSSSMSTQEYTAKLEEQVKQMVSSISGVGKADVMITLENGVENVYANSEKKSTDSTTDADINGGNKATDKNNTEQDVVIVDGNEGNEALVVTQREPTVKGVVVVCDGGDNPNVVMSVTDAVTTALNITSNRVSVVKATTSKTK